MFIVLKNGYYPVRKFNKITPLEKRSALLKEKSILVLYNSGDM